MSVTNKLIEEREATHGNVQDNAKRLASLNSIICVDKCDVVGDLSLRMLNLKLARFISSGYKVKDSIDDALGYLQLGGKIKPAQRVVRLPLRYYLAELGVPQSSDDPIVNEVINIVDALFNHDLKKVKKTLQLIQKQADEFNLV